MYTTNTHRSTLKARTILMSNGIRINWRNIAYLEIDSQDTDGFSCIVKWKYKASIRSEVIELKKPDTNLVNYFKQYSIVQLTSECYVNLSRIMTISEETIYGPQDITQVRIVFLDGFEVIKKIPSEKWQWWKTNYA